MPLTIAEKQKLLAGRQRVEAYRTAHSKLYDVAWHEGIPEAHNPLLKTMLLSLSGLGFASLQDFFNGSELLNIQELGFEDMADYNANATKSDELALEGMWR